MVGTFGAFQCECRCTALSVSSDPDCGKFTIWYASEIRNVIQIKSESTEGSMELIEYNNKGGNINPGPIGANLPTVKIEKPEWKLGYEWKFAWRNPISSGTLTREVIRHDVFAGFPAYVVRVGKNQDFYAKDVLGLLGTMSEGKITLRRNAPLQPFSWPLQVGKEWRNSYTLERLAEKSTQNFSTIESWSVRLRPMQVPAGAFEAFKIEIYGAASLKLLNEYWYSPQVKWFVPAKFYQQDGIREEELMSYKID